VVTSLNRTLMPIINYSLGDRGRIVASPSACACGRRLRQLELLGRCGGWLRLGCEDLYLEQVAAAVSAGQPELSLLFCLHIRKSERLRDLVDIHIEAALATAAARGSGGGSGGGGAGADIEVGFEEAAARAAERVVEALLLEAPRLDLALMERPVVTVVGPGAIPRNARTGKISPFVDHR